MSDPPRISDFKKVMKLHAAYELQPGKHYLIVADRKSFSPDLLYGLFKDLRAVHPELDVFVIETLKPGSIVLMEKKDGTGNVISGETGITQEERK